MIAAAQIAENHALDYSYTLFSLDDGRSTSRILGQIAQSTYPVLLVGEPGTGKRSCAQQIHLASPHREGDLVVVSCEKTDALELEGALLGNHTLYLESVCRLPRSLQGAVVAHVSRKWDATDAARIICGDSQPLGEQVRLGKVSENFFYAIAGITLHTVPLRHQKTGIFAIADYFLEISAREAGLRKPALREDFVEFLMQYSWPGNLSELEAAMKATVLIGDQEIALAALQASVAKARRGANAGISLKEVARTASMRAEEELISEVLKMTGGNRKLAARELKVSYKALLYKLKRIGVGKSDSDNGDLV